ncbi:Zn-ribbon domain-containing OB-fold protein [Nocardia fusca]|uniref:Zn-ribbon domain-containing OB-fold protein n=1 Tax=Nocardia fusca TaxID=941183 RepID=UPI0037AD8176
MTTGEKPKVPVVRYLRLEPEAAIVANRCTSCGALYVQRRSGCGRCGSTSFEGDVELSRSGRVVTATVVHRGPKGVPTPFTSGVVALDGGGSVRTTITGPGVGDPVSLVGAAVHLETSVVGTDSRGVEAVAFTFTTEATA